MTVLEQKMCKALRKIEEYANGSDAPWWFDNVVDLDEIHDCILMYELQDEAQKDRGEANGENTFHNKFELNQDPRV